MKKPKMPKVKKRKGQFTKKYKQYQKEQRAYNKWKKQLEAKRLARAEGKQFEKQMTTARTRSRQAPTRADVVSQMPTEQSPIAVEYPDYMPDENETKQVIYRKFFGNKLNDEILYRRIISNDELMLEGRMTLYMEFYDEKGNNIGHLSFANIIPYKVKPCVDEIMHMLQIIAESGEPISESDKNYIITNILTRHGLQDKDMGKNLKGLVGNIVSNYKVRIDYA